ncbi:helix-turn-helix domain-containing protein [Streptosporangium sp. NPDC051022]|uniref:TetR/AcrR family transcriptional regulator n=1 Tax=Streptosporangium sp. NPDC051022 TaxID=3155752 RepID=UPI0034223169
MATDIPKPLRADAARNFEKITRTARQVYAERGPETQLDEIARRADVGIATLYRHFPDKTALLRAALDQAFDEQITPAIEQAMHDDQPRRGLATVLEAALSLAINERNILATATNLGAVTAEAATRFFDPLTLLARRGQQAGVIRADLVPEDIFRAMAMLISVLPTMDPHSGGWRRYLTLILDALSPEAATPLPPAVPLLPPRPSNLLRS